MADQVVITIKAQDEASSTISGISSAIAESVESFKSAYEIAAKVVEKIIEIVEAIKRMQEEVEKMRDGMEEAAAATAHQADAIELANLKLEDQIAKLQGASAENGLKEALLAAVDQARNLTQALDTALQKADDLLKKQSIGFLKSLFTGQEETSDLKNKIGPQFEQLKEMRREELLEIEEFQQRKRAAEMSGHAMSEEDAATELKGIEARWKEKIQAATDGANRVVNTELEALKKAKQARIDYLTQDHDESVGDQTVTVAALSHEEAVKQVNEQYKVREQLLRQLGVQATGFYQTVAGEEQNLQERLKHAKDQQDAEKAAKAKQAAQQAEERLRKNIGNRIAEIDAEKKISDARFKNEEEQIKASVAAHKTGAEEELKQEQDLLNRKFEADEAFLNRKLKQLRRDPTANANQIASVQAEIEKLKIEHDTEMLKLGEKYNAEVEKRNKKQLKDEIDAVEEKVKAAKAGSAERVQILEQELQKLAAEHKADTEEYKRLVKEKAQAEREFWKQLEALEDVHQKTREQHQQALRDQKLSELDFERQLGRMSESEYEQRLRDEIKATYKAAMQELEAKKIRYRDDPVEYAKAEAEIVKLTDKYNADIEKADQKSLLRRRQQFDQYFKQVSGSFNTALNGWMQGTESASQAFGKMFQDILSQLINFVEQWIEKKIEMWLMDKLISEGSQSAAATAEIASNAAVAYSGAYAATAAIPFVGPELAPEAAWMAYMDVMAMAPAGFALGGIVPATGLALVHEGERVLPASMSGTGNFGSPSVQVHFNVSAIDAESFKTTIKRHGNMIGNEVARVLKRKGFAPAH